MAASLGHPKAERPDTDVAMSLNLAPTTTPAPEATPIVSTAPLPAPVASPPTVHPTPQHSPSTVPAAGEPLPPVQTPVTATAGSAMTASPSIMPASASHPTPAHTPQPSLSSAQSGAAAAAARTRSSPAVSADPSAGSSSRSPPTAMAAAHPLYNLLLHDDDHRAQKPRETAAPPTYRGVAANPSPEAQSNAALRPLASPVGWPDKRSIKTESVDSDAAYAGLPAFSTAAAASSGLPAAAAGTGASAEHRVTLPQPATQTNGHPSPQSGRYARYDEARPTLAPRHQQSPAGPSGQMSPPSAFASSSTSSSPSSSITSAASSLPLFPPISAGPQAEAAHDTPPFGPASGSGPGPASTPGSGGGPAGTHLASAAHTSPMTYHGAPAASAAAPAAHAMSTSLPPPQGPYPSSATVYRPRKRSQQGPLPLPLMAAMPPPPTAHGMGAVGSAPVYVHGLSAVSPPAPESPVETLWHDVIAEARYLYPDLQQARPAGPVSPNAPDPGLPSFIEFLALANRFVTPQRPVLRYPLPSGDAITCVLFQGRTYITGTDIVRSLMYRHMALRRQVCHIKKFEEGVFSDLRNLKPGLHATLQEPRSPLLGYLDHLGCIRTQKKQKVFFWECVPHDRLMEDAVERDVRRERCGHDVTTVVVGSARALATGPDGKPDPAAAAAAKADPDAVPLPWDAGGLVDEVRKRYANKLPRVATDLAMGPPTSRSAHSTPPPKVSPSHGYGHDGLHLSRSYPRVSFSHSLPGRDDLEILRYPATTTTATAGDLPVVLRPRAKTDASYHSWGYEMDGRYMRSPPAPQPGQASGPAYGHPGQPYDGHPPHGHPPHGHTHGPGHAHSHSHPVVSPPHPRGYLPNHPYARHSHSHSHGHHPYAPPPPRVYSPTNHHGYAPPMFAGHPSGPPPPATSRDATGHPVRLPAFHPPRHGAGYGPPPPPSRLLPPPPPSAMPPSAASAPHSRGPDRGFATTPPPDSAFAHNSPSHDQHHGPLHPPPEEYAEHHGGRGGHPPQHQPQPNYAADPYARLPSMPPFHRQNSYPARPPSENGGGNPNGAGSAQSTGYLGASPYHPNHAPSAATNGPVLPTPLSMTASSATNGGAPNSSSSTGPYSGHYYSDGSSASADGPASGEVRSRAQSFSAIADTGSPRHAYYSYHPYGRSAYGPSTGRSYGYPGGHAMSPSHHGHPPPLAHHYAPHSDSELRARQPSQQRIPLQRSRHASFSSASMFSTPRGNSPVPDVSGHVSAPHLSGLLGASLATASAPAHSAHAADAQNQAAGRSKPDDEMAMAYPPAAVHQREASYESHGSHSSHASHASHGSHRSELCDATAA